MELNENFSSSTPRKNQFFGVLRETILLVFKDVFGEAAINFFSWKKEPKINRSGMFFLLKLNFFFFMILVIFLEYTVNPLTKAPVGELFPLVMSFLFGILFCLLCAAYIGIYFIYWVLVLFVMRIQMGIIKNEGNRKILFDEENRITSFLYMKKRIFLFIIFSHISLILLLIFLPKVYAFFQ